MIKVFTFFSYGIAHSFIIVILALFFFLSMLVFCMQVVLAANDLPSINDVTYPELVEIISKVT